jgi:hypothetical protein
LSSPHSKDVLRQTVEAVYGAALAEVERLKPPAPAYPSKEMTAYEAKFHLRRVRYLRATAMREEGKTLAAIGLLLGVSRQRVNQLLKPPAEYKRPGRPRRGAVRDLQREREALMTHAAFRYCLQVRNKFTYVNDPFEIGLLVNSLLRGAKQFDSSMAKDWNPFGEPVALSDISITLAAVDPAAPERAWYSLGAPLPAAFARGASRGTKTRNAAVAAETEVGST